MKSKKGTWWLPFWERCSLPSETKKKKDLFSSAFQKKCGKKLKFCDLKSKNAELFRKNAKNKNAVSLCLKAFILENYSFRKDYLHTFSEP